MIPQNASCPEKSGKEGGNDVERVLEVGGKAILVFAGHDVLPMHLVRIQIRPKKPRKPRIREGGLCRMSDEGV